MSTLWKSRKIAPILALWCLTGDVYAQVYKCIDGQRILYQATPCENAIILDLPINKLSKPAKTEKPRPSASNEPSVRQPTPLPGSGVTQTELDAMIRHHKNVVASSNLPPRVNSPLKPLPLERPPYPAGRSEVHVLAAYGSPWGPITDTYKLPGERKGINDVKVTVSNASLLLLGYEPTEWIIDATGIVLSSVTAIGFHDQKITLNGGGSPRIITTRFENFSPAVWPLRLSENFWTTKPDANNRQDIAEWAQATTGKMPATYQTAGAYEKNKNGFSIGPNTSKFALASPVDALHVSGPVTLKSSEPEAVLGYTLRRGKSGAYTEAYTDRVYSEGKFYFEGLVRVVGLAEPDVHAGIGICKALDHYINTNGTVLTSKDLKQPLRDKDVIGVAVDFGRQRVYFRINGAWQKGAPGSDGGFPLMKGREYRACGFSSGTLSVETRAGKPRADTTWEFNFGGKPFAWETPNGYLRFEAS